MSIDIHYFMAGHDESCCVTRNASIVPRVGDEAVLPWGDDEPDEYGYKGPWITIVLSVEWRVDKRVSLDHGNDVVYVTLDDHPALHYSEVTRP